jgi:hypothetical protein
LGSPDEKAVEAAAVEQRPRRGGVAMATSMSSRSADVELAGVYHIVVQMNCIVKRPFKVLEGNS